MFVQRVLQIMKLPILVLVVDQTMQKKTPLVLYSLSWFHSMTRKISPQKGPTKGNKRSVLESSAAVVGCLLQKLCIQESLGLFCFNNHLSLCRVFFLGVGVGGIPRESASETLQ